MDIKDIGKKIVIVPCRDNFFRWWFEILKPIHHLTNRESDVIAAFVEKRFELSKSITDPDILDSVLMQESCKKEIREMAMVTPAFFQVIMGKLKKNDVIKDGKINPKYIPPLKVTGDNCALIFLFKNEST